MVTVKDALTIEEQARHDDLTTKRKTNDEVGELMALKVKAGELELISFSEAGLTNGPKRVAADVVDAADLADAGGASTDGSSKVDAGPGQSGKTFWTTRHYSYDSSPKNPLAGISKPDWMALMKEMVKDIYAGGSVDFMACIFHDKDVDVKTGAPVELHFHTFVRFKDSWNERDVKALFGTSEKGQNTQKVKNNLAMAMYIIHVSKEAVAENKTIYPRSKVFTYNCDYNELVKESFWKKKKNDDNELQLVDEHNAKIIVDRLGLAVMEGEISRLTAEKMLRAEAGYSYVRRYAGSFANDQRTFIENRAREMRAHGRNLRNMYIMGAGGIGKSSLAEVLANVMSGEFDYKVASVSGSGKTSDMYGGCTDEMVLVSNELNPKAAGMEEFHVNTDPSRYAPPSSRHEDANFIGHTGIYTNSLSPLRFAKSLVVAASDAHNEYHVPWDKETLTDLGHDKYWQTIRRFKNMMIIIRDKNDKQYVQVNIFNLRYGVLLADGTEHPDDGVHIYAGSVRYKAIPGEKPEITPDVVAEILRLIDVDMRGVYTGAIELESFLEQNKMTVKVRDNVLDTFIADVVSRCVWTLLPTTFLYELYKAYRIKYFRTATELTIQEFTPQMKIMLDGWKWKKTIKTTTKMSADEPLITEFNLVDWMNPYYRGENPCKTREFIRKDIYRGFEKI